MRPPPAVQHKPSLSSINLQVALYYNALFSIIFAVIIGACSITKVINYLFYCYFYTVFFFMLYSFFFIDILYYFVILLRNIEGLLNINDIGWDNIYLLNRSHIHSYYQLNHIL